MLELQLEFSKYFFMQLSMSFVFFLSFLPLSMMNLNALRIQYFTISSLVFFNFLNLGIRIRNISQRSLDPS